MKTNLNLFGRILRTTLACLMALTLGTLPTLAFPLITNVVETGGDNEATDTITAKWTGVVWNTTVGNEPTLNTPIGTPFLVPAFGNGAPTFVDRAHRYTNASGTVTIPSYLAGGEYIMSGNDNRDNVSYQLDISVSEPAIIFMLVDNRLTDGANGDPPNFTEGIDPSLWTLAMTWLGTSGYQPLTNGLNRTADFARPDEVGLDEGSDGGINNWYSIYWKQVPAGTSSVFQADNGGRNMYGVVVTPVAPRVPTGLNTISLNARLALNWNPSPGAREYILRRSDTPGGPYTPIVTNATTSYVDVGLVNFQNYYYVVSAVGLFGESANSGQVVGTPKLAPENLVAVGGTNRVALSWTALSGAISYTVKRAETSGGPYTNLVTGLAATSFSDEGLPDGRRFYYTVSAPLSGGGESANADDAVAFTAAGVPTGAIAESFAATVIRVRWTSSDQVPPTTLVERSADGVAFSQIGVVTNAGRFFLHAGLGPNATNYYRVRATNSSGFSTYSSIVVASTPSGGINVNFADSAFTNSADYPLPGYLDDHGLIFGDRGNGFSYGWDDDNTQHDRLRNAANSPDRRYDTFNHLQKTDPLPAGRVWEIGIANGLYLAHIVSGDPTATDSTFQWDVEGWVSAALVPAANNWWREFNLTIKVEDGRMTFNNGPTAANNKINFVDIYPAIPTPNTLGTQPVSQTITQSQSVTFSASVTGGPEPYLFQWYHGVNPIPGATGPTHVIPLVQTTDAGQYSVVVTNAGASVTSTNATLTVIPDTFAPVALSAGSVDGTMIAVCFNEAMDSAPTGDPANFLVNGAAGNVSFVTMSTDQRIMFVSLNTPIAGNFTLAMNTQKDLAGNALSAAPVAGVFMGLTPVDIGFPALAGGSYTCDGDTLVIGGGGADIWGASDQGHVAYKPVSGNFDARVRVNGLVGANAITKALLMARNTVDADSPTVHISVNPVPPGRDQFEPGIRTTQGGGSAVWGSTFVPAGVPNIWLRLTRIGDEWRAYRSSNGLDYILSGITTQAAPADILVGLAVTAHDNNLIATGSFSGFSVSAPVAAPPTLQFQINLGQLTLNWSGNFWLVEADEVTGPWVTNTAASSGFIPPMNAPRKFYGLQPK